MELLYFLHIHHVSLIQWTNCLPPTTGSSSLRPESATHTLDWDYLLALSCYKDVIIGRKTIRKRINDLRKDRGFFGGMGGGTNFYFENVVHRSIDSLAATYFDLHISVPVSCGTDPTPS